MKPTRPLDKLVSISSPSLGGDVPASIPLLLDVAPGRGRELMDLLRSRNGFFAFESALHVFPVGVDTQRMSLESWNSRELWRGEYAGLADSGVFFAEDLFGNQFCLDNDQVGMFDAETGEVEILAPDLEGWAAALLERYDELTGFPLAHAWQQQQGVLPPGKRLVPKLPFVLQGKYELSNLALADSVAAMRARGNLARQIRDAPDGTRIQFSLID